MDKQLKDLKVQFEQIPVTFTEKDKQAIREKIENLPEKRNRKRHAIQPKLLTGVVVAVAVILLVVTFNQQSGLFMSSNNDSAKSSSSDMDMAMESQVNEARIDSKADKAENSFTTQDDGSANSIQSEVEIPNVISTKTYNETIALSDELQTVYNDYKATVDDTALAGLSPFDVFKLYQYAEYQGDLEVVYALFFKKDGYEVPDKKIFLEEAKQDQTDKKQYYERMLQLDTFEEKYLSDTEVLVAYTLDYPLGFRLLKDTELNVWKVSWLASQ